DQDRREGGPRGRRLRCGKRRQRPGGGRGGNQARGQRGQGGGGERLLLLEARTRVLDGVRGREEDREGLRVESPLPVPGPRQDVFQAVARGLHQAHVHGARGALEVVRRA